eukprot:m51a1_g957 putative camk camkl ampk protein kinase (372) ;mRNA; r:313029-315000
MRMITHKNIVNLLDVLASKTKVYIVSELASGGELFYRLANVGRFTEEKARFYFQQLISGIAYCHSVGVCHRDLKPENLLLSDDGQLLKISDFGLSALHADMQSGEAVSRLLHTQCGTPNYVAPEVLAGFGYEGTAADVWSCGVVLYVFLAGFLPFEEASTAMLFKKIQTASYKFPTWFTSPVKSLISKILVVDPKRRLTIAQIQEDDWFKPGYMKETTKPIDISRAVDCFQDINDEEQPAEADPPTYNGVPMTNAFSLISSAFDLGKGDQAAATTKFFSKEQPAVLFREMTRILTGMKIVSRTDEERYKIRANAQTSSGVVGILIQLFMLTPEPPVYIVEFRKSMGDTLEFHKIRAQIYERSKPLMLAQRH